VVSCRRYYLVLPALLCSWLSTSLVHLSSSTLACGRAAVVAFERGPAAIASMPHTSPRQQYNITFSDFASTFSCREDAFQEYVELEAVYLDCLEAAAQGSAHSGGVGSHTDFGEGHGKADGRCAPGQLSRMLFASRVMRLQRLSGTIAGSRKDCGLTWTFAG
jgi:hypothetical protein